MKIFNLAIGSPVTSDVPGLDPNSLQLLVDGAKRKTKDQILTLHEGFHYIQVDLGHSMYLAFLALERDYKVVQK
jgi:hypothetical protein